MSGFYGFAFTNADFLFEVDTEGGHPVRRRRRQRSGEGKRRGAGGQARRQAVQAVRRRSNSYLRQGAQERRSRRSLQADAGDAARKPISPCSACREQWRQYFLHPGKAGHARPQRPGSIPRPGSPTREFLGAAEKASGSDTLTLVDVPGLPDLCAKLSAGWRRRADAAYRRLLQGQPAPAPPGASRTQLRRGCRRPPRRLGSGRKVAEAIAGGGLDGAPGRGNPVSLQGAGPQRRTAPSGAALCDRPFADKGKVKGTAISPRPSPA